MTRGADAKQPSLFGERGLSSAELEFRDAKREARRFRARQRGAKKRAARLTPLLTAHGWMCPRCEKVIDLSMRVERAKAGPGDEMWALHRACRVSLSAEKRFPKAAARRRRLEDFKKRQCALFSIESPVLVSRIVPPLQETKQKNGQYQQEDLTTESNQHADEEVVHGQYNDAVSNAADDEEECIE